MKRGKSQASARAWMILLLPALLLIIPAHPGMASKTLDPKKIIADNPAAGKILDVPFIAQQRYDCGPAGLAMVLRFHGVDADADAIAREFESENVAGTFTVDLLIAATEAGMDAHWVEADLDALKKEINAGRPVIVFLNLAINPLPQRHFAVAVGYLTHQGKDYLVLHSGNTPLLMVQQKKFMRQWKRTGFMMMTVSPASEKPEPEKEQTPRAGGKK